MIRPKFIVIAILFDVAGMFNWMAELCLSAGRIITKKARGMIACGLEKGIFDEKNS
jgi:hypothetical protein